MSIISYFLGKFYKNLNSYVHFQNYTSELYFKIIFVYYICIIGHTYFPKTASTAKIIISQITQPGKFSGVSTMLIYISELYKRHIAE